MTQICLLAFERSRFNEIMAIMKWQALSAPQCGANRKLSAPQCGADQLLSAPQCGANQILSAPHLDCQRYKGEIQEEGQRDSFASKNTVENTYTIANTKSRGPKLLVFPRSLKVLDVIVSPCNCPALEAASKTLSIYCAWLITKF